AVSRELDDITADNTVIAGNAHWPPSTNVFNANIKGTPGSCNYGPITPPPPPVVDHVNLLPATATIVNGDTKQFNATAVDATNHTIDGIAITWSSSDDLTATVSPTGLATSHKAGKVTITASAPSVPASTPGHAELQIDEAPAPPAAPGSARF